MRARFGFLKESIDEVAYPNLLEIGKGLGFFKRDTAILTSHILRSVSEDPSKHSLIHVSISQDRGGVISTSFG